MFWRIFNVQLFRLWPHDRAGHSQNPNDAKYSDSAIYPSPKGTKHPHNIKGSILCDCFLPKIFLSNPHCLALVFSANESTLGVTLCEKNAPVADADDNQHSAVGLQSSKPIREYIYIYIQKIHVAIYIDVVHGRSNRKYKRKTVLGSLLKEHPLICVVSVFFMCVCVSFRIFRQHRRVVIITFMCVCVL